MEYHLCEPTYEILCKQFQNGDIIKPFDGGEPVEILSNRYYAGDFHCFTKGNGSVKVYDGESGQLVEKVGFGIDSDKEHMKHVQRCIDGWKASGCETMFDYMNQKIENNS